MQLRYGMYKICNSFIHNITEATQVTIAINNLKRRLVTILTCSSTSTCTVMNTMGTGNSSGGNSSTSTGSS